MAGEDTGDGTPFGRYRLLSMIGEGGMGEVWRARDTVIDRVVAIKVLSAKLSKSEEFQRRFRREAHAAARLETPHVVPIYDYGEVDGRLFVSMRLIRGRDLATVLADGPLDPPRAVRITGQVAEALQAAHETGLIHRDIKPSNILLDDRDFAYLIDFGIARVADDTRMTNTGNTIGTFAYIAPERLDLQGEEDARVDIYSLACVLYECLTGKPPFVADTTPRLIMAHMSAPPPRPSVARPDVPAQLDEVIATGMAKDPDERYATTVQLADAARDAITVPNERPRAAAPLTERAGRAGTAQPKTVKAASAFPKPTPQSAAKATTGPSATGKAAPIPPMPMPWEPAARPWWRRAAIVFSACVVTAVVIATAIAITSREHKNSDSPKAALPSSTHDREPTYGPQITMPFTDLTRPNGVAVDNAGGIYVADGYMVRGIGDDKTRVLKLASGTSTPTVLPFTGLDQPEDVAVDAVGNVYVADGGRGRVLKLPVGSSSQAILPFSSIGPVGVALDSAESLYVIDMSNNRVLKLAEDSMFQVVLPFTGIRDPVGVAVDAAGNVYVSDGGNNRVLKLGANSSVPTVLPFTGLKYPSGVAVDAVGNVYVVDWGNNLVLKLAGNSSVPTVMPFTGLNGPQDVAVDSAGNLFVADAGNRRVLKLPVQ